MEPEITDIFDRIMNWKLLRFMWPFYKKNKDKLLYLFFVVWPEVGTVVCREICTGHVPWKFNWNCVCYFVCLRDK